MKSRNRIAIPIIVIILILVVIITIVAFVFLKTDVFKKPQESFFTYLIENEQVIKNLSIEELKEYSNKMQQYAYSTDGKISMNVTDNTSDSEYKQLKELSDFSIDFEGKVDPVNKKEYENIDLIYQNNTMFNVEFLRTSDLYGFLSQEITDKYIAVRDSNLQELFKKLGYQDYENIPNNVDIDSYMNSFNQDDTDILNLFFNIIMKQIPEQQYTKNEKSTITVFKQGYQANSYQVEITDRQLDQLLRAVLEDESLKNNELIMKVKEAAGALVNTQKTYTDNTALKIIVYESGGRTLRTQIELSKVKIIVDNITQNNISQSVISVVSNDETNQSTINILINKEKTQGDLKVTIDVYMMDDDKKEMKFNFTANIVGTINSNIINQNFIFGVELNDLKLTIHYDNSITFSDSIEIEKLTKDNAGILNDYNSETLIVLINNISERLEHLLNEKLGIAGITLGNINVTPSEQEQQNIDNIEGEASGLSELEETARTLFNAKFEQYKGTQTGSSLKALLTLIKTNNTATEVNNKVGLMINESYILSEVLTNELIDSIIVQIQNNLSYTVDVEYDLNTKYVNKVIVINDNV